jgi:hypothetical protein
MGKKLGETTCVWREVGLIEKKDQAETFFSILTYILKKAAKDNTLAAF